MRHSTDLKILYVIYLLSKLSISGHTSSLPTHQLYPPLIDVRIPNQAINFTSPNKLALTCISAVNSTINSCKPVSLDVTCLMTNHNLLAKSNNSSTSDSEKT